MPRYGHQSSVVCYLVSIHGRGVLHEFASERSDAFGANRVKEPSVDGYKLSGPLNIKANQVALLVGFQNFVSAGAGPGREVRQRTRIG